MPIIEKFLLQILKKSFKLSTRKCLSYLKDICRCNCNCNIVNFINPILIYGLCKIVNLINNFALFFTLMFFNRIHNFCRHFHILVLFWFRLAQQILFCFNFSFITFFLFFWFHVGSIFSWSFRFLKWYVEE